MRGTGIRVRPQSVHQITVGGDVFQPVEGDGPAFGVAGRGEVIQPSGSIGAERRHEIHIGCEVLARAVHTRRGQHLVREDERLDGGEAIDTFRGATHHQLAASAEYHVERPRPHIARVVGAVATVQDIVARRAEESIVPGPAQ